MPPRALASTSKQACTSAAPAAPVRVLPHDFVVSWSATHKHFLRWTSDGTWDRALAELQHPGPPCPRPQPGASAGVIDSCSIKASPVRAPCGFDGAKKIDGIKRHIVVATLACWWPCWSPRPACRIGRRCPGCSADPATAAPRLDHLRAEQGYTGSVVQAVSRILRFTIQIVGGIKLKGGFITQPRRWVIERTFAWMQRCRRLTRQYEQTPLAHEAMVVISQLALMLRRLDRMTEPPP
jgi:transposase